MEVHPQGGENRLQRALAALSERRWTVAAVTLATLAGAGAILVTTERSYTATAEVLVKTTVAESSRDEEVNLETERRVAISHEVVSRAAEDLGLEPDAARNRLEAANVPGTEILTISYTDDEAAGAQVGARVFAGAYLENRHEQASAEVAATAESIEAQIETLERELAELNRRARAATTPVERIAAQAEADVVLGQIAASQSNLAALAPTAPLEVGRVVQPPPLPSGPSGAGPVPTLVLALILGLTLGVGAALFKDRFDQRLRDRVRVEAVTGAPVLAAIPPLSRKARRRGAGPAAVADPGGPAAEAYRLLRARLAPALDDAGTRTILVTSPHAGEGKSATAANLGVVFAQANKRTAVVTADLRRPTLHETFNVRAEPGLSTLLSSASPPGHLNSVPTGVRNLVLLPSGPLPRNPAELLDSGAMAEILRRLRETAEIVILDSPPLLSVADATTLAGMVDAVVLVADARTTTGADLADAAQALRQVNATLVGSVLNNFEAMPASVYATEAAPA